MRACAFGLFVLLMTPTASPAQGAAALAAARSVAGTASRAVGATAPGGATASKARASAAPAAGAGAVPAPAAPVVPAPKAEAPIAPAAPGAPVAPATPDAAAQAPALEQQGHSYDPEGRRDPFVSLLRRGSDSDARNTGNSRPPGLKGLGASEVTLKGTMASQGGYVGILQGSDAKTYVVHPGEQLFDGTIRAITADALVILQQVSDPLSTETHREVRKVLRQTEEAR